MKRLISLLHRKEPQETFPAWRDVRDCFPEAGTEVLVFSMRDGDVFTAKCLRNNSWLYCMNGVITHWMPLTPPPAEFKSNIEEDDE